MNKTDLLNQRFAKVAKVDIEGTTYSIKTLSGKDHVAFANFVNSDDGADDREVRAMAMLVRMTLIDESRAPLFSAQDENDIQDLPLPVLTKLFQAAAKHNGLNDESQQALEKN